jgi:pheromone shutdown protein TraB
VSVWRQPVTGRIIYLVGTVHISIASAELVGNVIDNVRPDAVFVEWDAKRAQESISTTDTSRTSTIATTETTAPLVEDPSLSSVTTSISNSSKEERGGVVTLPRNASSELGEEFYVAIREGQKVGAEVIRGDRDQKVSLRRMFEALWQTDFRAFWSPNSEVQASLGALRQYDIASIKSGENIKEITGHLKRVVPELYEAIITERDIHMADKLDKLNSFPVIVAVTGMLHVDGIETYLKSKGWTPVILNCKN